MTELLPNIFAIEVPENAKDFGCVHVFHGEDVLYYPGMDGETVPVANAPCHCDQVEILFTTKDCTNEQAAIVIDCEDYYDVDDADLVESGGGEYFSETRYKDYTREGYTTFSSTTSLQSLLRYKGLTADNYLIIKKSG